jgi:signal transduction histidine kinase/ligand-binding sensor domain-containing protein/DNA-binding response OmpR family regulator
MASCNSRTSEVPFPKNDSVHPQPVAMPLKWGAPKKLEWVTVRADGIKPVTKKLDLETLPYTEYDSTGFHPIPSPPEIRKFDISSFGDTTLDLEKVPAVPLTFKTSVLRPPVLTKAATLVRDASSPIDISDIGLAQGLPDKKIFSVLKDRDGLMWIGTDKGLYCYDGEYMRSYGNIAVEIAGLLQDKKGRIWYISPAGIGVIDLEKGTKSVSAAITLFRNSVYRIIEDHRGLIWVPMVTGGFLAVVDPEAETVKLLDQKNGLSGSNKIGSRKGAVIEDRNHNIWIGTNVGIDIYNPTQNKLQHLTFAVKPLADTIQAFTLDKEGKVWASFRNSGVYQIDLEKSTVKIYGPNQGLAHPNTYKLLYDRKDRLWVATNQGLYILDTRTDQVKYCGPEDGLPVDFTLDCVVDARNRVWVATFANGLTVIDNDAELIHPLGVYSLSCSLEDSRNRIWIGAGGSRKAIQILDLQRKRILQLDKTNGLADDFIQTFLEVDGKIWVATNGGFEIIDPVSKTIEHIGKKEGLSNDQIYGLHKDTRGNVWFVGPTLGIDLMDSARKTIRHAGVKQGLSAEAIIDIRSDLDGNIWLATQNRGVDVIDISKGTVQNLSQGPGLTDTCNRILIPDKQGRMWVGTDKGVYIVDKAKGTLQVVSTSEGLCNDYVTSLLPYKDVVVVSTKSKASIITPPDPTNSTANWKVTTLAGSEGLSNISQTWASNLVTRGGKFLWVDPGVTYINEIKDEAPSNATTHIVGISVLNEQQSFTNNYKVNEKDTIWTADSFYVKGQDPMESSVARRFDLKWDSVAGPYSLPVNLKLPHDRNFLQFRFAQANIGRSESTLYSYILEGVDKKWSEFTSTGITDNYINIGPGQYTFKVRSKDVDGRWGKPASFSFTILPPWWQTWWMYLVYALAIAGAIFEYNRYRSKALTKENRILEEKVAARTLEVKQQAEELTTINQISQALVSQADLHDLIQLVGNQLRDLFKANIVYIALLDKKTKVINFPYQFGDNMAPLKLGEGLTSKIILSGQPLLINKNVEEERVVLGVNRVGMAAASYLGVPIPVADEIIGVLSIQSTQNENSFEEKDKNLLTTIAANVGVAIRKARLFEEVKQANTEADLARKTAEQANAAKSAFLSTVSHELRTPLTSVLGFAKITKKRLEEKIFPITDQSDPKTVKTIEQISSNLGVVIAEGERLTTLINDVLDLAKIEAGKMEWNMEEVFLPDIVDRAIAATSALFDQKSLILEKQVEVDLPIISGDRDKLIQVVVNLLSNAVKFTKEGNVNVRVFKRDGGIVVGITDTGIGIAPEDHDKVFEQFKQVGDTLTDKPKGTGLGLPICKEIVERHGGTIWLESEFGKGSTFYFMLPGLKAEGQPVKHMHLEGLLRRLKERVEVSQPIVKNNNATILIVDDDDGIRSLLRQELGEVGYTIEEAANGKEAVSKIRTLRPDLVILDVMMPEMNGFDVAAILKNDPLTMDIPIIILSIVQDKSRGFRIGVDRYLTKPIDTNLLFTEIGDLLEQGKSKKKVMVVDEDSVTVRTLTDVLQAKGYQVVESDGNEMVATAIANQPDIIILNSAISEKHEIVQTLRFEKGLENVLFLIYQ